MIFFNKMFADKRLLFYEGANRFLSFLIKIPVIGSLIEKQVVEKDNKILHMILGIIAQLAVLVFEFFRKFLYVLIFIYIPYRLIGSICPLIASHKEETFIFMFLMLSTICGSLANNILMSLGDRDYLMIKVMLISPYMNFLGKLVYKMITEFVYFTVILYIFDISLFNSIMLGFITLCARPVGEMLAIIIYEKMKWLYNVRSVYNGIIMAVSMLFTYVMPVIWRRIDEEWLSVVHPAFAFIMFLVGVGAFIFLWRYKYYRKIIREAIHIKREF